MLARERELHVDGYTPVRARRKSQSTKGVHVSTSEFPVALEGAKSPTLMWAQEHEVEAQALQQLRNIAALPWVHGVRVMPDVHLGKGATVGSVIAMKQAVSPAAVGVDIGCGMDGVLTSLTAADLPDDLRAAPVARSRPPYRSASGRTTTRSASRKLGLDRGWDRFWGAFSSLHDGVQDRERRRSSRWARWAAATTSSRSASTTRTGSG